VDCDPALFVPGLDLDDDLALLFLLGSPEVELLGVTTVAGNTLGRLAFRDAKKLLSLAGRSDVPVKRGAGLFARDRRPTDASRFLVEMVRRFPGEITLLALGPLTNVAAAAVEDPFFERNLRDLVAMGGRTVSGRSDFNFRLDPRAAASVVKLACPKVLIAFDLGLTVAITRRDLRSLPLSKNGLFPVLLPKLSRFARLQNGFRSLRGREPGEAAGGFHPWDVVAAAFLVKPELFGDVRDVHVSVDAKGRTVLDAFGVGGQVSMPGLLDVEGFREMFFERVAGEWAGS
jgi:purine nucleosidase